MERRQRREIKNRIFILLQFSSGKVMKNSNPKKKPPVNKGGFFSILN